MNVLTNNFHGTEIKTRKTNSDLDALEAKAAQRPWTLTNAEKRFIVKVRATLCGCKDCDCGDFWARR